MYIKYIKVSIKSVFLHFYLQAFTDSVIMLFIFTSYTSYISESVFIQFSICFYLYDFVFFNIFYLTFMCLPDRMLFLYFSL